VEISGKVTYGKQSLYGDDALFTEVFLNSNNAVE